MFIQNKMSSRAYNLTIGLILLWGFGINILMCKFLTPIFMDWNFILIVIGYFASAILGIHLSATSDNALISFIGYNLVVLPVGIVLSLALAEYDHVSIMNAFLVTAAVTLLMIFLSIIYPNVFLSLGKVLFFSLLGVIIFEVIFLLLGISTPTFWDFLVALIFCGYIGYDWANAQTKEYTLDNAVDSVVELYLDIVNLFIRILEAISDDD